MSAYIRAKREDYKQSSKKEMSIRIGSVYDSFDTLKAMCNDKSNELVKAIELSEGEELEIVFWTEDIPELIGTSRIIKNDSGLQTYTLDFSLSTL
ncbi:MAG: hypothetical protein HDS35_07155 [Bacteroides sp.]|nr:hypothetical protein [Bacteroides sp.]